MDIRVLERNAFERIGLGALAQIPQPPERLWLRGALPKKECKKLVVVGSRALTPYGEEACRQLVAGLSGYPISIISGLALGTDACAHRAALSAGLHTVAIPGSGLAESAIAPRTNLTLAHEILDSGGALLSEHPPETTARPAYFPSRNRLMVGMADAVLIIEAAERSGTLITARMAADYNRDLLCVPHRIGDQNAAGGHRFIRDGAALVSSPVHILEALGIPEREDTHMETPLLSAAEERLFALLANPLPKDELLRRSGLSVPDAQIALLALELKGLARESYGVWGRA